MVGCGNINKLSIVGTMSIREIDNYNLNIDVANTYSQFGSFHKVEEKLIEVNEALGEFKIKINGTYKFDVVASLFPGLKVCLHFALFVNDLINADIEAAIDFKNAKDTQAFSGAGIIDLKKDDILTIKGKVDHVPSIININHMNINLFRIGC